MSPRLVWVLGQCLWLATFLVVSLIIYGILNFFPNILTQMLRRDLLRNALILLTRQAVEK